MLVRDLSQLPESLRGGAVTIGNFDGVHLGHARIVEHLRQMARRVGGPAVVCTFEPHPLSVLRPEAAPTPLSTLSHKAQLLAELGVDATVAFTTNRAFLGLSAEEFFDQILCRGLAARAVIEGPDFRFGRGRQGDLDMLRRLGQPSGLVVEVVEPVESDGQLVSSSRVRAAVSAGQLEEANHLLTRPYRIEGTVVHGAGRGRTLGYPTANVADIPTLLPSEGIYAGLAWPDGRACPAAISLGPNPTFGEGALKVEVFVIDYSGDLYDRSLAVDFLRRLRNIERFDSVQRLVDQMDRDVAEVREIAKRLSSLRGDDGRRNHR